MRQLRPERFEICDRTFQRSLMAIAIILLAVLPACSRERPANTVCMPIAFSSAPGVPVASFDDHTVSAADLVNRISATRSRAQTHDATIDQTHQVLDQIVGFDLLAKEAVRQGLQTTPEVIATAKAAMVRELVRREIDVPPVTVREDAIASYYEKFRDRYNRPASVRLGLILVRKSHDIADMDHFVKDFVGQGDKVGKAIAMASKLGPKDELGFARLVGQWSEDDASRRHEGDLGFLTVDELAKRYGAEAATAQATLQKPGDISSAVIETADSYLIFRLEGRQEPLNLTLEQVRPQIEASLAEEMRHQRYVDFLDRLKKSARLTVDEHVLATIGASSAPPAAPAAPAASAAVLAPPPTAAESK